MPALTFKEFEAGRFGGPALQSQGTSERFVLLLSAQSKSSRCLSTYGRRPSRLSPAARVFKVLAGVPSDLDFLRATESAETIPGAIDSVYQGIS